MSAAVPSGSVVVSGLVWRQAPEQADDALDAAIVGPAVGAGLGVVCAGQAVELLVSLSRGLPAGDRRFVDGLDGGARATWVDRPPVTWRSGPIRGEASALRFDGDPRGWPPPRLPDSREVRMLALANGNPRDHLRIVTAARPARVALDIDGNWAFAHPAALNVCIRASALVTVTQQDFGRLPAAVVSGTRLGRPGGPALLVKRGAAGVSLRHDGAERGLPPPALAGPLRNDCGAGDFLLGFLAGKTAGAETVGIDGWEQAYRASLPHLARLLTSASFHRFADSVLGLRRDG